MTSLLRHLPGAFRRFLSSGCAISETVAVCQSGAVFEDLAEPLVLACGIILSFCSTPTGSPAVDTHFGQQVGIHPIDLLFFVMLFWLWNFLGRAEDVWWGW